MTNSVVPNAKAAMNRAMRGRDMKAGAGWQASNHGPPPRAIHNSRTASDFLHVNGRIRAQMPDQQCRLARTRMRSKALALTSLHQPTSTLTAPRTVSPSTKTTRSNKLLTGQTWFGMIRTRSPIRGGRRGRDVEEAVLLVHLGDRGVAERRHDAVVLQAEQVHGQRLRAGVEERRPGTGVETTVARTVSAQSSKLQVPRVASARSKYA